MAYFKARVGVSGGNEPVLLWENPNPNAVFSAQTITISNLSDYKYLVVKVKGAYNENNKYNISYMDWDLGEDGGAIGFGYEASYGTPANTGYARRLYKTSSNTLYITNGTANNNNAYAIPVEIYGLKKPAFNI